MSACLSAGVSRIDEGREGRAAMLKKRFAETILKARQQLQKSDNRRKEAERRRRRDLMVQRRREMERQALEKIGNTVWIDNDNAAIFRTLQETMCCSSTACDLFYGGFCGRGVTPVLQRLGLFLKEDYQMQYDDESEEEEEED